MRFLVRPGHDAHFFDLPRHQQYTGAIILHRLAARAAGVDETSVKKAKAAVVKAKLMQAEATVNTALASPPALPPSGGCPV